MKTMIYKTLLFITILVVSCSGDDDSNSQNGISGNWELSYYETTESGRVEYPKDGKPVVLNLKDDGTYDGVAGNNEILGEYSISEGKITMTLYTSKMANTEWEKMFKEALETMRDEREYILPYSLNGNNLVMDYGGNNTMHFIKY